MSQNQAPVGACSETPYGEEKAPQSDSAFDTQAAAPTLDDPRSTAQQPPASSVSALPFPAWERYQLLSFVGSGGMGSVFKAVDPRLKRTVAIKFLRAGQISPEDTKQKRRFEREARAQARIDHPHICKIYEVGEVEGQPYIAMQYIVGASLAVMQNELPRADKIRLIRDIALALQAAHEHGVIHRDIKPANIMVERRPDGSYWPYLLDFGLAREVDGGSQTSIAGSEGTPAFMAPEQVRGEMKLLDQRTDVYGLCGTLYAALCGRPPFIGSPTEILLATLLNEPPPLRQFEPTLSAELNTIVQKGLEKEQPQRYQSAKELAEELTRLLDGARIVARPPSIARRWSKFARRHKLVLASLVTGLLAALVLGGVALRARMQARAQARLGQSLAQEIRDLEWLLRSARQLPLHNLDHEKSIVRRRMQRLQAELQGYGDTALGLAHYALGRGHLGLHEYPQALTQLQLAIQHGNQSAEVHYALGIVLGKHFEQAIYEVGLSGEGEWARTQRRALEPKYLTPAITALKRSRALKLDAPEYLEALIAFYSGDEAAALARSAQLQNDAPWIYEAAKLAGDVHHHRALRARDQGNYAEAEAEFTAAVQSYQRAATIGQSDAEIYEALAETWVRQLEMLYRRSLPTEAAYAAVIAASDKLTAAEPQSSAGWLKKALAAMQTMSTYGAALPSDERVKSCLDAANAALRQDRENPYAAEFEAACLNAAAMNALARGENPEPLLEKSLQRLTETVKKNPHFLWGLNDLAATYSIRGSYFNARDHRAAKRDFEQALRSFIATTDLDSHFGGGFANQIDSLANLVALAETLDAALAFVPQVERAFSQCIALNRQERLCHANVGIFYTRLAYLSRRGGRSPRPYLAHAQAQFTELEQLGVHLVDAEQHMALAAFVDADDRISRREAPTPALQELRAALERCFALAPKDAMCRTLAAQAEWVNADWLTFQGQPVLPTLQTALDKAKLAAQSPESRPETWQTLAETHLRLARALPAQSTQRALHLTLGISAAERALTLRPQYGMGLATLGALRLLSAQGQKDAATRRSLARTAAAALQQAQALDGFLRPAVAPINQTAEELAAAP